MISRAFLLFLPLTATDRRLIRSESTARLMVVAVTPVDADSRDSGGMWMRSSVLLGEELFFAIVFLVNSLHRLLLQFYYQH